MVKIGIIDTDRSMTKILSQALSSRGISTCVIKHHENILIRFAENKLSCDCLIVYMSTKNMCNAEFDALIINDIPNGMDISGIGTRECIYEMSEEISPSRPEKAVCGVCAVSSQLAKVFEKCTHSDYISYGMDTWCDFTASSVEAGEDFLHFMCCRREMTDNEIYDICEKEAMLYGRVPLPSALGAMCALELSGYGMRKCEKIIL